MSDYIKTGVSPGPILFREVEPVAPYPRINPQQPKREEYPRQQSGQEHQKNGRSRRRFTVMRDLVDKLKESFRISRVDFFTAEAEMQNQGLDIAEELLIGQLLKLKIPLTSIDEMFQQIRRQRSSVSLLPGRRLTDDDFQLFPENSEGLSEYSLIFSDLSLRLDRKESRIVEEVYKNGRFIREVDRFRLIFRSSLSSAEIAQDENLLQLDIHILVGAIEIDDVGRRAILYPRSKTSYGLYADKQINLSI